MNGLSQWDKLRHFKADSKIDQWGDPHQMQREILVELDNFREWLGMPIIVTSGYRAMGQNGQEGGSQHCLGLAVDIVVPSFKGTLLDLFFDASRFHFNGIGIYKDWTYNGKKTGGLHLDARDTLSRAQWFCYKDPHGTQQYTALTTDILKGFKIV